MRWDLDALPGAQGPVAARRRHGGFVSGAQLFDNSAFVVSRSEALVMDPQQRLLLDHGYVALHAGHRNRASLGGALTSLPSPLLDCEGLLHVFVRGPDRALWQKRQVAASSTGTGWTPWRKLGGTLAGSPTPVKVRARPPPRPLLAPAPATVANLPHSGAWCPRAP